MRFFIGVLLFATMMNAQADSQIKMNFRNEDLTKIIETYSRASGQKFVVDPSVRGKISIFLQESVSVAEAFNHLSSALAVNGYAISKQGDTMVVKSARNIQRDLIEVSTERPALKPERMYTWIYNVKNLPAESINRDLRVLMSKDGEMAVSPNTNQIIFTDWASNLNRVAELMKEIDKQLDPATSKLVQTSRLKREAKRGERETLKGETGSSEH